MADGRDGRWVPVVDARTGIPPAGSDLRLFRPEVLEARQTQWLGTVVLAPRASFRLFTLAGLLIYAVLAVTLIATGPTVPWDLLEYGLPVLMAVSLVALFPFSRLVWLAFDLMLRPVTPQELEWHRAAPDEWSSVRDASRD